MRARLHATCSQDKYDAWSYISCMDIIARKSAFQVSTQDQKAMKGGEEITSVRGTVLISCPSPAHLQEEQLRWGTFPGIYYETMVKVVKPATTREGSIRHNQKIIFHSNTAHNSYARSAIAQSCTSIALLVYLPYIFDLWAERPSHHFLHQHHPLLQTQPNRNPKVCNTQKHRRSHPTPCSTKPQAYSSSLFCGWGVPCIEVSICVRHSTGWWKRLTLGLLSHSIYLNLLLTSLSFCLSLIHI